MKWIERLIIRLVQAAAAWLARCIPVYDPAKWNEPASVRHSNNCYNYATDIRTDTFAQPGRASGNQYTSIDCAAVGAGAVSDGLTATDCDLGCGCRDCCHQVALVIWPGYDYHWYRHDQDGTWSHKPGGTAATNLDNSGNVITDPRTADRGGYTVFCGCYCVCDGVSVN